MTDSVDEIRVVAAVIERDGSWLVGKRPLNKRHGGLWEFPGGKLASGETVLDAARRELAEELSMNVGSVGHTLFTARDGDTPFVIDFVDVRASGTPRPAEHVALGWYPLDELEALELAPADRAFVGWLRASRS